MANNRKGGFTIVELLIVIVVIGILASLVLNTFANAQKKARDAQRAADVRSIKALVLSYDALYGELPRPVQYQEVNAGGYDTSVAGKWLPFLKTNPQNEGVTATDIPKDPINNEAGDPTFTNAKYAYFYYCYHPPFDAWSPIPDQDVVRIGYREESTNQLKYTDIVVTSCLQDLDDGIVW